MSGFQNWQMQRLAQANYPEPLTEWWTNRWAKPREMTREDLGLPRHDWSTSEGRKAAIWERINVASDPTVRKLELMRCRTEQVLPIVTSEEFADLWKRCELIGNPLDGVRLWDTGG